MIGTVCMICEQLKVHSFPDLPYKRKYLDWAVRVVPAYPLSRRPESANPCFREYKPRLSAESGNREVGAHTVLTGNHLRWNSLIVLLVV